MSPNGLPTVLVVDDDLDLLPMLRLWLEAQQLFYVVTATNGIEALEVFEKTQPACVVVDMKMPHINGLQFMQAIRGDPRTAATPLIMLTARDKADDRFAGLATGADRYLTKPADPILLVQAILEALALTEAQRLAALEHLAGGQAG